MPGGFPFRSVQPAAFDMGLLAREGYQLTGTSIGSSNASGGLAVGATLGGIAPPPGHAIWVESITLSSLIDITVWIQRADSGLIANGAASPINPISVGPSFSTAVLPVNALIREGESISFILRTAVPTGSGSDTFGFRAGFNGRRVTNDFAFDMPKTMLVVGDSISTTTISSATSGGTAYGSDFYHAQLARSMRAARKGYRRILKGDGGWKTSNAVHAMKRNNLEVAAADLIVIMLGTNETLLSDYQANLPLLYTYCRDIYPDAAISILGPPPRQDSLETSLLVPLRTWASSYVSGLNDPKARFTSLASAFDRAIDSNYLSSDGTGGTRVHPVAAAHTAMRSAILADWQGSTFWGLL